MRRQILVPSRCLAAIVIALCWASSVWAQADNKSKKTNREQAVEWMRLNRDPGIDAKIVDNVKKFVDTLPEGKPDFMLEIGSELTKSGKATWLLGWRGGFWAVELTAAQSASAKIDRNTMTKTSLNPPDDGGVVKPDFEISKPVFDGGTSLPVDKEITGKLPFKNLDRESLGYPSIRLTFWQNGATHTMYSHYLSKFVRKDDKEFSIKFRAHDVKAGPVLFVLDVVEYPDADRTGRGFVVSNPVLVLVDFTGGKPAAGGPSTTDGPKPKADAKTISATALTQAFIDNEDAARKKYGGLAPLVVEGVVKEVFVNKKGEAIVYLKGATDKLGVTCVFDLKDSKDAAKLKANDKVTVAGAGYGLQDGSVLLGFCKVFPAGTVALPKKESDPIKPTPKPPAPKNVVNSFVRVAPSVSWKVVSAAIDTPAFHNRGYNLAKLPKELEGSLMIQRAGGSEGDTGFLNGKVITTKTCTLYVAVMWQYNGERRIQDEQLAAFAKEGWKEVSGDFELTTPPGEVWRWRVYSRSMSAGAVAVESKAVPAGGIFFLKQ